MNKKIAKIAIVGAVIGVTSVLAVKKIKNSDGIDLEKGKDILKGKKDNLKNIDAIKNIKDIKNICNEKISKINTKQYSDKMDKLSKLKSSLFNKQSSTSVVFGNPTYNVYGTEGESKDGQE